MSELKMQTTNGWAPSVQFCTDHCPEAERFTAWQDQFVKHFANHALSRPPQDTEPFFRRARSYALGDIHFACFEGSPVRSARAHRFLADGNDDFVLHVNQHGAMHMTHWTAAGTAISSKLISARHGALLSSNGRVSEISYNCSTQNFGSLFTITIPRKVLLPLVKDADSGLLNCCNHQLPLLQSLSRCGEALLEGSLSASFTSPESVGDYLLDLVSMVLGPTRDACAMANRSSVRTARLARILEYVKHSFLTRELQVSHAANYLGTTERYVQQLLEEEGRTFTELVQESRLNAAATQLSMHTRRARTIGDIATQCGFNNVTYFNRMFKQRFAKTPREYRTDMATTVFSSARLPMSGMA